MRQEERGKERKMKGRRKKKEEEKKKLQFKKNKRRVTSEAEQSTGEKINSLDEEEQSKRGRNCAKGKKEKREGVE